MKHLKFYLPFLFVAGLVCMSYTTSRILSNPTCPTAYTGAPKATAPNLGQVKYCTSCHGDFAVNPAGGGLTITGLPTSYTPGMAYSFSIKISHATANRKIWGFAIKAVNTVDNKVVGSFTTTNSNASVKGTTTGNTQELSHASAAVTANASNYTYANLTWTAPAAPGVNDGNIRFYVTGNAGDNDGSEAGDYIYTTTVNSSLSVVPVTLDHFSVSLQKGNTVQAQWQTSQEINSAGFELQYSTDGNNWFAAGTADAKGSTGVTSNYSITHRLGAGINGTILYRLKMNDKNGNFSYSETKSIAVKGTGYSIKNITAQPLPAGENAIFEVLSEKPNNIGIRVIDASGTTISRSNTMISQGINRVTVNLQQQLRPGLYFIKFVTADWEKTVKQLIQ